MTTTKLSAVTVTLKSPVEVGGKTYASLTLQSPRTGEMRRLHRAGVFEKLLGIAGKVEAAEASASEAAALELLAIYDDLVPALAILAHVDEAVIDALELEDTNALIEKLNEVGLSPL